MFVSRSSPHRRHAVSHADNGMSTLSRVIASGDLIIQAVNIAVACQNLFCRITSPCSWVHDKRDALLIDFLGKVIPVMIIFCLK